MFTLVHVVISVVGIIAGLVVAGGLMAGERFNGWTLLFLAATIATSVTGFGFPFTKLLPSHVVGALSLVVLAVAVVARYLKQLQDGWRITYAVAAIVALYLNIFVLIVQLFVKTPALAQLAPTQQEAPFAITQAVVFMLFVWIGQAAVRGFR